MTTSLRVDLTRNTRRAETNSIGSFTNLGRLPDKYRLPLVYAAIDDLDHGTIARMLKVRRGTVKTLVFRARQLLKERVDAVLGLKGVGAAHAD